MSNHNRKFPIVLSKTLIEGHLQVRQLADWEYARIMIILNANGRDLLNNTGLRWQSIELGSQSIRSALQTGLANKHRIVKVNAGSKKEPQYVEIHIDNVFEDLQNGHVKVITIVDNRTTRVKEHFIDEFPKKALEEACQLHDAFTLGMRALVAKTRSYEVGAESLVGGMADVINDTSDELAKILYEHRQNEQRLKASIAEQETQRRQEAQRQLDDVTPTPPAAPPATEAPTEAAKPTPPTAEAVTPPKPQKAPKRGGGFRDLKDPPPVAETAAPQPATRPSKPKMERVGTSLQDISKVKLTDPQATPPAEEAPSNGVPTTTDTTAG